MTVMTEIRNVAQQKAFLKHLLNQKLLKHLLKVLHKVRLT